MGALGVPVQLTLLALFNRWMAGRYLYAAAAAIELTLLHNFIWHLRFTWRDRRGAESPLTQFLRFQLSAGLIAIGGNLLLMRLLVGGAHLPVVVSNLVAIAFCSMANFWTGDRWVFTAPVHSQG